MSLLRAKAPGKLLLFGDYVVLEGAPGLSVAVPQSAHASYDPLRSPCEPFVFCAPNLAATFSARLDTPERQGEALEQAPPSLQLLVRAAAAAMELSGRVLPAGTLSVDTREFYHNGRKLGLGSSAAALVCAMQAMMRSPVVPASVRAQALSFETLSRLHRAWQHGRGSGVDVATSLHGGVIRFQLPDLPGSSGACAQSVTPLSLDDGPPWVAVAIGQDMNTRTALRSFEDLKEKSPAVYWSHMEELAHVSRAAIEFWMLRQHIAFVPLVSKACEVLSSLGEAMGVDVVSAPHRQLSRLALNCGGAYKPSGAGGGDVGVALFSTQRERKAFVRQLRATTFRAIAASAD